MVPLNAAVVVAYLIIRAGLFHTCIYVMCISNSKQHKIPNNVCLDAFTFSTMLLLHACMCSRVCVCVKHECIFIVCVWLCVKSSSFSSLHWWRFYETPHKYHILTHAHTEKPTSTYTSTQRVRDDDRAQHFGVYSFWCNKQRTPDGVFHTNKMNIQWENYLQRGKKSFSSHGMCMRYVAVNAYLTDAFQLSLPLDFRFFFSAHTILHRKFLFRMTLNKFLIDTFFLGWS